jgi:hypothetical protein
VLGTALANQLPRAFSPPGLRLRNSPLFRLVSRPASEEGRRLFDWARDSWCTMREEFSSNSFLAVTVAGLVLLFSGLIAFAFT